jgi:uncharacterized repeat protein (TIGR03943 family)
MRKWDARGVWSAALLAAWAGVIWFLLASGRWALYLSTRTLWVLPVGAAVLTAGAIGRLVLARNRPSRSLSVRDSWTFGLLAVPLVVILALPPTTLGSYAVSRRSSFSSATGYLSAGDVSSASAPTLLDVAAAQDSPEVMRALSRHAGENVTFVGFVQRDANEPSDEFELTRFVITCCIPDALLVQVRTVDVQPGRFTPNEWVQVTGSLYPVGTEVLLDAQQVKAVPRPGQPYLYP